MSTTLKLSEHQAEKIGRLYESLRATWAAGLFDNPDKRIGALTGVAVWEFANDIAGQAVRGKVISTRQPRTLKALLEYWDMNDLADQVVIED